MRCAGAAVCALAVAGDGFGFSGAPVEVAGAGRVSTAGEALVGSVATVVRTGAGAASAVVAVVALVEAAARRRGAGFVTCS